jgi:TonB family protein
MAQSPVDSCGDALCYARALTRLERLRLTTPRLALGSAGGSLLYRIQRLAGDAGAQPGPSKLPGILALSLGLLCLALNMQWARGQQRNAPPAEPAAVENRILDEPGVRVDLRGAGILHREEVEYPDAAIEKRIQGTVVVEATLDATGMVSDACVLSGPQELRKAALESVLQWHFTHDAARSTRQVAITFQWPADGDTLQRYADHRSRKEAERALVHAQREQARIEASVQRELAEEMAKQARDLQRRLGDASEFRTEADKLAEQAAKLQAEKSLLDAEQWQRGAQAKDLEHELEALRDQTDSLAEINSAASVAELKQRLAELQAGFGDPHGMPLFAGRRLKIIDIQGLPAASRDELLTRLPVHVGDILAEDSMEKVDAAVKQFDEHLGVSMLTARDGQVEIRIAAPGYGDHLAPPQ